ncbi:hypothetical protein LXM94_23355 [Rhizobium sp. TRM95111]|uniref:hypothetical protein n=1 Tax=Rhizobium alarense TaxID=2846851 RepID=UPI001F31F712|nr:hypothetical protein [Rhizobium alarense]MCF3642907.1 hypothetical protein [Rhizobium alarense]
MRVDLVSRRTFLHFAAAGSAATLPAVASVAADRDPDDSPQLTETVEACLDELEALTALMTHFNGDGVYDVRRRVGFVARCHVAAARGDHGQRTLWAGLLFDGHILAPRERIDEADLVRCVGPVPEGRA